MFAQYQSIGKWTIMRKVRSRATRGEYKSCFPHHSFGSSYEARVFLHERGLGKMPHRFRLQGERNRQ